MARSLRYLIALGLTGILVIDLGYALVLQRYETEHNTKDAQAQEKKQSNAEGPFLVLGRAIAIRTGNFIIEEPEVLTALATIVMAVFTWRLWWSTDKLWAETKSAGATATIAANAARDSADAVVNTSRPVLLPRVVEAAQLKAPNVETGNETPYCPKILFIFENYGKGIATITKVKAELFVFGEPPETRQFSDNVRVTPIRIVVPGEYKAQQGDVFSEMNAIPARLSQLNVSTEDIALLRKNVWPFKRFFLVGVVEYEDLLGFEYEGGFSLKVFYNLQQGPRGGSGFNYYKYKRKGEHQWRQP
jgi:hypothetical protein